MKKTRFYRICRGNKPGARFFKSDDGYIYSVTTPGGRTIEFAIAKTPYNEWDITHVASGQLGCVCKYRTKKDAVQQLSDSNYLAAVDRLTQNKQANECAQLLNIHKFKMEEV
jgi:hypothetical protein